jgi:CheY-like chemotaxis protein
MSRDKSQHILVIEGNPRFQEVILKTLAKISPKNQVHFVNDPQDALNFLTQKNDNALSPRPHLILLDVNGQEMNDRDFLARIKSDDLLKIIPVIVLTDSENWEEILMGYQLHANCYVYKPVELDDFANVVEILGEFWLKCVQLPSI